MYLSIYTSCVCFHCIYCFDYSYSLTCRICLFRSSTVHYHQQQCEHVRYQDHCQHALPSKCNRNTTSGATGTRYDNGNGNENCDTHTTQQWNAGRQQSPSIINSVDTSSIKSVANTSFLPSATRTPQQQQPGRDPTMTMAIGTLQQQQLEPERDPTMAIVTHRQQHGNREMGLRISKQYPFINMDVRANE